MLERLVVNHVRRLRLKQYALLLERYRSMTGLDSHGRLDGLGLSIQAHRLLFLWLDLQLPHSYSYWIVFRSLFAKFAVGNGRLNLHQLLLGLL